jgi:para-nitrobenzyl esterase
MQRAWIAFAAGGEPGWPGYDSQRRLTRVFDGSANLTTHP